MTKESGLEKMMRNLVAMSVDRRYEYFVSAVANNEEVWSISVGEDAWIIFNNTGDEVMPLWPSEIAADRCMYPSHRAMGARPQAIGLDAFLDGCIADMNGKGVRFGIFPVIGTDYLAVEPSFLEHEIVGGT